MIAVVALFALALASPQADPQEKPRVPDDSIELTVTGCLKGRVLTTVARRAGEPERGIYVGERTFRVNGNKEVMDEVKKRNKQLVEVVGLVRRAALDDKGIKSGRVAISGGSPVAGSGNIPTGVDNTPVMDVSAIRPRATSCDAQ
jgi:hypothetical protein